MRRIWTTAVIDNDYKYAYLGSTTGVIVAFDIQNYYFKHFGPVKDKDKLQAGISQLELFINGATKTMKRSMIPKQTGSKKTAVPTRGPPRKVDINGRVPIVAAERSLIPRQKDAIRPREPSCDYK
ncbi:MAG: hypothetical protein EZS28_036342 [Streblomastix strix]|uniref:Uncharacterized protein n=1 Tax=Streblomastix strix TaxID=222440 RepID=A0A5J4UDV8_9EUKA|nr:MAG: hypothetical protein EZS28_036342 [Streblomastix strix]